MVKITPQIWVDPGEVQSMTWDRRDYMNVASEHILIIVMKNKVRHVIHHQPQFLDGVDAFEVERQIIKARV